MKIIDCFGRVRALYPHPFEKEELISWCNDLGSLLCKNYCERFESVALSDNEPLPEGVTREDILRVILGGKVLERDDFSEDLILVYPESKRLYIKGEGKGGKATVIYRLPYNPIRYIDFSDTVTLTDGGIKLNKNPDIRPGDILISDDEVFNVTGITDEGVLLGEGFTEGEKHIERIIDDLTVLDSPYDTIYVEYLIANAARFLKDYETENRALANYNAKLLEYQEYLVRNGKTSKATRIFNFW